MYIDSDGDIILESREELEEFVKSTPCRQCANEARMMLSVFETQDIVKLVWCIECEHR